MPAPHTAATPIPFLSRELACTTENARGLHGLPPWLVAFVRDAMQETGTLRENGAEQAAVVRTALLQKLLGAARAWLDAELDLHEAAQETGRCEETIRRAVRAGTIPDRRANRRGRHRIRRADLQSVAPPSVHRMIRLPMPRASPNSGGGYDPEVQAVLVEIHRRAGPTGAPV